MSSSNSRRLRARAKRQRERERQLLDRHRSFSETGRPKEARKVAKELKALYQDMGGVRGN